MDKIKWIENLGDNWDGEGAPAIRSFTWDTLVQTLQMVALCFNTLQPGARFPEPAIAPVADGRIDLYWESSKGLVIATMPLSREEPIYVYYRNAHFGTVRIEVPHTQSNMVIFAACIAAL